MLRFEIDYGSALDASEMRAKLIEAIWILEW